MIITISGSAGSGKSTVGKIIAEKLELKHYSMGDLMRKLAIERGLDMAKFSSIAEKDRSIDDLLDKTQVNLGKKEDNFVLDSRLGFYFIPHSIKIFLSVNMDVGAKRIYLAQRPEESAKSIPEIKDKLIQRLRSENERYNQLYKIKDYQARENYDLVIDTTNITANEAADKIIIYLRAKNHKNQ